ncbi:TnsA-like heteromeric transposase endonuclease subunit [Streptomyces sp. HUAS TT20]|uniref:TnsA-like heteromeric transposase endonuclease subunit n=1 Tax=Streptomyces sp. HUAS TT20 TaxID=3447509 RepID=UPI0021DB1C41|nr:TnsA-like heteromeric transposase endonuclease subunit [Streptomyces sp. HUAS 15-9]UXY26082.1 TnsA-like heteromeric transposase endonuclease subunit [Streptomyces sp. HUAS 15-9]
MSRIVGDVSVSLRRTDGTIEEGRAWHSSGVDDLGPSKPHYSGTYWSSTMRDHVVYESRLELTRLLYDDFDRSVTGIWAQPFLLSAKVDGQRTRHVPDFLVRRDGHVPLVVDVKPRHLLIRPKTNYALGWAREVALARGWDFELWSEPPESELANLRFLAGYRRDWLFDEDLLTEIREADLHGASLGESFRAFPNHSVWKVRAAVLRLLWCQHFVTDLTVPLSERHELRKGQALLVGAGRRDLPPLIDESGQDETPLRDEPARQVPDTRRGASMTGAAVRVGVGTRLMDDGEAVVVEAMFGAAAGNEVLVRDGSGRRFRLSVREVLTSSRAAVIPERLGPASDDDRETASVILAQLTDAELAEVRERAAHMGNRPPT